MNNLWLWIALALLLAIVFLLLKIAAMRRSAKEIKEQLSDKLSSDTNTLIDISSRDKELQSLAAALNVELKNLRSERIKARSGDRQLKEAVANISHDLRTPLTAICGYLDILEKDDLPPEAREYIKIIGGRAASMRQLTEELLKYSIVRSQEDLALEEVVINNVLEECLSAFYAVLCERQIIPEIDICDEPVVRKLNKNALSRVFGNIISNAAKYSDGDLKIELSADGRVRFSNKAAALDEITAGRLFDRFYTVKSAEKTTGLGLSIAKTLTESLGGKIACGCRDGSLIIELKF